MTARETGKVRRFIVTCALSLVTFAASPARGQSHATSSAPASRMHLFDTPCAGCLASFPMGTEPVPLIVALHGDGDGAAAVHEAWEKLAAPRSVAVLAVACPKSLGCEGSFWRWNGAPSWIDAQIAKLSERRPIDRERVWLAAWSGGASYVGYRTQEFEGTFAAIVIHGGGMPPEQASCSENKPSVYFLVGDGNPLHALAVRLRDHYARCGNEISWDLLRGADHGGEWRGLAARGSVILDWLATRRRASAARSANVR